MSDHNDTLIDTVLCHYNAGLPDTDDRALDCTMYADWHLCYEDNLMSNVCDQHLGSALRWKPVKAMHKFGSACNLERSLWSFDLDCCVTEELGLELGLLTYAEENADEQKPV
jgi:hypothetical protein